MKKDKYMDYNDEIRRSPNGTLRQRYVEDTTSNNSYHTAGSGSMNNSYYDSYQADRKNKGLMYRIGTSKGIVVTLSALGGLIFGYNTGVITGALGPITEQNNLNTVKQGLVVCATLLGALIGAVGGGLLANKIGRKPVILLIAIVTVGGAASSAAVSPIALSASLRIILGMGVGASSAVCPLMVSEVVPVEQRGRWGSVFQVSITVGLLLGNVMGLVLLKAGPHNWRWMFAGGAVPGILVFPVWAIIRESPKFLADKNAKSELKARNRELGIVEHKKSSWQMLREPKNRRPMMLGIVLAVFSQLTGINAFMYFSNIIFEFAGFDRGYAPLTCSCILQFWNVSTSVAALFLVERVGRRILLFTGCIVMTASDLLLALFFVVLNGKVQGWLCIVLLFIFVGAFELSIGTLFWFVINEILDDDIKNVGSTLIVGLQWIFNLSLSFLFLSAVKFLGRSTLFWVFGAIGLVCTGILAIWLPPEKGNTQMGQMANEEQQAAENHEIRSDHGGFDDTIKEREGESSSLNQPIEPIGNAAI